MPKGAYRRAFIIGKWVLKIPRIRNLFPGARCNRWEARVWRKWRPRFKWDHLCAVRFCDPFGLILVMDRANQPVTFEEVVAACEETYNHYYPNVDLEYKAENWGRVSGKIVCVDYGIDDGEHVLRKEQYYSNF